MANDQKVNELARTLYSRGLAASMWDAKNKAADILGISRQTIRAMSSNTPIDIMEKSRDKAVISIMRNAGIDVEAVEKKQKELIATVQKEFATGIASKESSFSSSKESSLKEKEQIASPVSSPKEEVIEPKTEIFQKQEPAIHPKTEVSPLSESVSESTSESTSESFSDSKSETISETSFDSISSAEGLLVDKKVDISHSTLLSEQNTSSTITLVEAVIEESIEKKPADINLDINEEAESDEEGISQDSDESPDESGYSVIPDANILLSQNSQKNADEAKEDESPEEGYNYINGHHHIHQSADSVSVELQKQQNELNESKDEIAINLSLEDSEEESKDDTEEISDNNETTAEEKNNANESEEVSIQESKNHLAHSIVDSADILVEELGANSSDNVVVDSVVNSAVDNDDAEDESQESEETSVKESPAKATNLDAQQLIDEVSAMADELDEESNSEKESEDDSDKENVFDDLDHNKIQDEKE